MAFSGLSLPVLTVLVCSSGVAGSAVASSVQDPAEDYHSFVSHYKRPFSHDTKEFEDRRVLFNQRVAQVRALNERPNKLWTAGINALTDRTEEELAQLRGWRGAAFRGQGQQAQPRTGGTFLKQNSRAKPLPLESMNWTKLNTTLNIINQGSCGSCWAVTATTVLKAHAEIYLPKSERTFSTQELLSCMPNPHSCGGDGGCKGATVELALHYVMRHGLGTEKEEPYEAVTGKCARLSPEADKHSLASSMAEGVQADDDTSVDDIAKPGLHVALTASPSISFGMRAWERLPENKYEPLLRAVYERGPVAVSVAASAWSLYSRGIFDHCTKDAVIDHAVTLVGFGEGYGSDKQTKEQFWLVQNSWGPDWGEEGKIRILRRESDDVEQCGTDHQPEVGTACKGGPKQVKVCGMCGILYDSVVPHFAA